ncbi:hydrogenase expression/formation protein HypE [Microbulbifer yueqingensis]|uniref:Hydrogenase expression/formation protein HypE n=1 Tax=Microbulbifer yueqingensis TaxID=658219 RepID=A0A1G8ZSE4_9GAMM|nr:hydrogenase expression/formation protein HypE [Microbulbifer yueqingensis]SDK17967.1 hydrogenase expression/formation protein HypE [Microbulbifer yueqingensis]
MNTECPLPVFTDETVRVGHGSGGELSQRLISELIRPHFDNPWLRQAHDSATLCPGSERIVFTTDSFVVSPLFFPGGDIGELAVYGTVNDLAMSGAVPRFLSCSLILEEGLPMQTLDRALASMGRAARDTGVQLVTGDTKVVERGKGDGLYINTAGIGVLEHSEVIAPERIAPGDLILLSGDIGRHGMAVMATREGLEFESPLRSDCAPLAEPVLALLNAGITVHCLRDLTRGGLATALVELAESAGRELVVEEAAIPVSEPVQGACELLGLDPLYVANEGRFIAFVPADRAVEALAILQGTAVAADSRVIGSASTGHRPRVIMRNTIGSERLLDRLPGEQLPRIC